LNHLSCYALNDKTVIVRSSKMKNVLTIAGSDSCGGAGIQADLKTFAANGVYGMSVITAVTAQNTTGVLAAEDVSADLIAKQAEAVFEDIEVHSVKIGMLSSIETINTIACILEKYNPSNIVLDPVMISKSGYSLLKPDAIKALKNILMPKALIVTPNIPEAEVLSECKIHDISGMKRAARKIHKSGPVYVLIKGGHLSTDPIDLLFDGKAFTYYKSRRIMTKNTHGTGCTLSSAIAANLAKGISVSESIAAAKKYLQSAILYSLSIGKGAGPTNHFFFLYRT